MNYIDLKGGRWFDLDQFLRIKIKCIITSINGWSCGGIDPRMTFPIPKLQHIHTVQL